jgi:hypothetical protein
MSPSHGTEKFFRITLTLSHSYLNRDTNQTFNRENIPKMRELITPVIEETKNNLLNSLDVDERANFCDNASKIGSAWIHAIPLYPSLRLTDQQISCALHFRTLATGQTICSKCGERNHISHIENCSLLPNWKLARHECVKRLIHKYIEKTGSKSRLEPFLNKSNSGIRGDIHVTGPAAPNGSNALLDISVVSIASNKLVNAQRNCSQHSHNNNIKQETMCLIKNVLEQRSQSKMAKYASSTKLDFIPIVFSSGGTLHSGAQRLFDGFKKLGLKMGRIVYEISLLLIRSRSRYFMF